MYQQKFRKLEVWNKAMKLIEDIYKMTKSFPSIEKYGLSDQLRRAATSISLNIAEGSGSSSDIEYCRYLSISRRSCYEVICGLEIAYRLKYCSEYQKNLLLTQCDEIAAMLSGLQKFLKRA